MPIRRVVANKRCLMIRPYELSNYFIGMTNYTPRIEEDNDRPIGEVVPNTNMGGCDTKLYGYGDFGDINPGNYAYTLALSYLNIKEKGDSVIFTQKNLITSKGFCIYNYDASKYTLNVITAVLNYKTFYSLDTYFKDKKMFKIIDIYLNKSQMTGASRTGDIVIYYLTE